MTFQTDFNIFIVLYLFLAGLGAGAILSAVIVDLYDRNRYISYIKAASLIGMPLVGIGSLILVLDLGQGLHKPWLMPLLLINPTSAISWGTGILSLFIVFAGIYAAYNFSYIKLKNIKWLCYVLMVLSISTAGYTAVLLGALKSIPFWHQTVLPLLFIVSATSTGIGAALIVENLFFGHRDTRMLETGHVYLIAVELVVIAGMMLVALNGSPEMVYSAKTLLVGKYAFAFWFILIFLGQVFPFVIHFLQEAKKLDMKVSFHVAVELLVLLGGFYLRYLIVQAGVYTEKFVNYN